jgi:hypothetical protein
MKKTYTEKEMEDMKEDIYDNYYGSLVDDGFEEDEAEDLAKDWVNGLSKKEIVKDLGRENDPNFRKGIWLEMRKRDSLNLIKVEEIIKLYGYPGKSLVGEPTNIAAWYVIQHSSKIGEYLSMIEKEAKKKEIPFTYFAKMQDRFLTQQGKEQIYGTQGQMKQITNKETGKKEFFNYVSPIENPTSVNDRRRKAGFTTTVEENAKEMGMEYKVYTLDEIKKMN